MVCGLDADGNRQLFPAEILGILRNVGVIEMGIELASLFQDLFAFIGRTVIYENYFVIVKCLFANRAERILSAILGVIGRNNNREQHSVPFFYGWNLLWMEWLIYRKADFNGKSFGRFFYIGKADVQKSAPIDNCAQRNSELPRTSYFADHHL